jgi:hypothetical protein
MYLKENSSERRAQGAERKRVMDRNQFIKMIFRYLLFVFLAVIAMITGSRVTLASDCTSCAGKGICRGESDCSQYIKKSNGRTEK